MYDGPVRKRLRYEGHDYRAPCCVHVTICTYRGQHLFGAISPTGLHLNDAGEFASDALRSLHSDAAGIALDIDTHGRVRWLGPVPEGIDEQASDPRLAPSERRDAANYLRSVLTDGPVPAVTALAGARKVGFSETTIRRAKKDLHVRSARVGTTWSWSLPDNDTP